MQGINIAKKNNFNVTMSDSCENGGSLTKKKKGEGYYFVPFVFLSFLSHVVLNVAKLRPTSTLIFSLHARDISAK